MRHGGSMHGRAHKDCWGQVGVCKGRHADIPRTWERQHIRLSLEGQCMHVREVVCQCGIMGEVMHKGRFGVLMDVHKGTCMGLQNSWMEQSTRTCSVV